MNKGQNEKIVWSSYRSWKSYYTWLFFVVIWLLVGFIFPVFLFIFMISFLFITLHRYGSKYYITDEKVYSVNKYHVGKKKGSLALGEIETLVIERDLWGEMFGYGTVKIGVVGEIKVVFSGVKEVDAVVKYFKERTGNR